MQYRCSAGMQIFFPVATIGSAKKRGEKNEAKCIFPGKGKAPVVATQGRDCDKGDNWAVIARAATQDHIT